MTKPNSAPQAPPPMMTVRPSHHRHPESPPHAGFALET